MMFIYDTQTQRKETNKDTLPNVKLVHFPKAFLRLGSGMEVHGSILMVQCQMPDIKMNNSS